MSANGYKLGRPQLTSEEKARHPRNDGRWRRRSQLVTIRAHQTTKSRRGETAALLTIDVLRYIMNIFYGPFLTMFFFKITLDSVQPISIYNIIAYAIVGFAPVIIGIIIKERHQLATLRLGIIFNFLYILFVMIAQEHILDHLILLAFLYGTSTALYYYPHNLISAVKIPKKQRDNFELIKKVLVAIAGVLVPFLLGLFITTTDFFFATVAIAVLSVIQIILSLFLTPIKTKPTRYTPIRALRSFLRHKSLRHTFSMNFFTGLAVSDSAMQIMMTMLIFNSFRTDLNLGIITSVTNLIFILVSFLYLKSRRLRGSKWLLTSFATIPLVALVFYLIFTNDLTTIIYYVCYELIIGLLKLLSLIKSYNSSTEHIVQRGNLAEYWSIREVAQGLGRVLSFVLLLAAGLLGQPYLYGLLVLLTLSLFCLSRSIYKIKD